MSKAEVISQSIVLTDLLKGILPIGNAEIKSPFNDIANILLLKQILNNKNGIEINNQPIIKEFIFGNIVFQHNFVPPKFTIKENTNNEKIDNIKQIALQIIDIGNIENNIGAIGINYELIIDNNDQSIKLKDLICKDSIANSFEGLNITFRHIINDNIRLNLTIADGKNNNKNIIFISANFHNEINPTNKISDIFKIDFLKILKDKENVIFGLSVK